jgi:hypothetical protein
MRHIYTRWLYYMPDSGSLQLQVATGYPEYGRLIWMRTQCVANPGTEPMF